MKKKKFTVPEFKTWLEGIMQFQKDDWSPTREQWDEIYDKIMNLKEPVNKEKTTLNDSSLDEIHQIVYNDVNDIMSRTMTQMQNQMMQQQHMHPVPQQNDPNFGFNTGQANPAPTNTAGEELANKSFKELQKEYEDRQMSISNGTSPSNAQHKLPDADGPPEDFV